MPKAAVFVGAGKPLEIRTYPLLPPPEGYAQLKLIASGVCGTDVHIHHGRLGVSPPMMIGHEFVGRVTDVNGGGVNIGDAVIACIAVPCGECPLCLSGDDANCVNMGLTNAANPDLPPHFVGGYGEYNFTPVKNLVKISGGLDPVMVCVFACAGPTVLHAFSLMNRAGRNLGGIDYAVVQGLGPVGMFAVTYLSAMGVGRVDVITAGRKAAREEAAVRLGASRVYCLEDASEEEINREITETSRGLGADLVFEASGNPRSIPQGLALLRNRGVYLVPGQYSNSGGVNIQPQLITFKALQIIGSSQYSLSDIEEYLRFLEGNPGLHEAIAGLAARYRVEDVNAALEDAGAGRNIKTVLGS